MSSCATVFEYQTRDHNSPFFSIRVWIRIYSPRKTTYDQVLAPLKSKNLESPTIMHYPSSTMNSTNHTISTNSGTSNTRPNILLNIKRRRRSSKDGFEDIRKAADFETGSFRRCTSDPIFSRSSSLPHIHGTARNGAPNHVSFVQIAQRSSSKTVKTCIDNIEQLCQQQTSESSRTIESPEVECAMLSQWATDAYYKVVISKYHGISALCQAMRVFPGGANLQVSCCIALAELAASQQDAIQTSGGVSLIILAMRNHPQSIQVQSAACESLRNLSVSILNQVQQAPKQTDLIQLLERAKTMYMTPQGRNSVTHLLTILNDSKNSPRLKVESSESSSFMAMEC
jgi:hypothetical protein